jgi:hypothetical protein
MNSHCFCQSPWLTPHRPAARDARSTWSRRTTRLRRARITPGPTCDQRRTARAALRKLHAPGTRALPRHESRPLRSACVAPAHHPVPLVSNVEPLCAGYRVRSEVAADRRALHVCGIPPPAGARLKTFDGAASGDTSAISLAGDSLDLRVAQAERRLAQALIRRTAQVWMPVAIATAVVPLSPSASSAQRQLCHLDGIPTPGGPRLRDRRKHRSHRDLRRSDPACPAPRRRLRERPGRPQVRVRSRGVS